MSRVNRTNLCEEQAALRRSVRQREKQGEVPDSGIGYSSDSELLRDQREKWSTETVIGQEDRVELQFGSKRTMSRRDDKGDRDSAKGGSEQPSMTDLFQMMLSENRRRDEEARRREDIERNRREDEQRRRDESMLGGNKGGRSNYKPREMLRLDRSLGSHPISTKAPC